MFSVATHESVSCPNCYVKSSSRCFHDSDKMQVGLHEGLKSQSTQRVMQLP